MQPNRLAAVAAALLLAAGSVPAQTGPGPAAQPGASAPRGGPGSLGRCCGSDDTPGWSMMTRQERQDHRTKLRAMTGYAECKAYMDQHHQQMVERAKDKKRSVPSQPRRDVCAGLKR